MVSTPVDRSRRRAAMVPAISGGPAGRIGRAGSTDRARPSPQAPGASTIFELPAVPPSSGADHFRTAPGGGLQPLDRPPGALDVVCARRRRRPSVAGGGLSGVRPPPGGPRRAWPPGATTSDEPSMPTLGSLPTLLIAEAPAEMVRDHRRSPPRGPIFSAPTIPHRPPGQVCARRAGSGPPLAGGPRPLRHLQTPGEG